MTHPLDLLRHHVTGAIERGDAEPITEQRAPEHWACPECGCTDVQETAWVHVNTGANTGDEPPRDVYWCPQCAEVGDGEHRFLVQTKELKPYTRA